ncbi:Uncharacterised protein [Yersinia enterocolitica]|nr:Uncharacterised protein [Yersinia enterocolitica]CQG99000.1 Uncharacterised protein [Yersinia enterocolitica]CQH12572.1 Uncharacterised protein [Yersinia enterocolitica]CQH59032.1 Uncharacterised protein [Yersinia enterocolitica]CQH69514.1 Uncharacterised protein [Yersinia enterocolitica]
MHISSGFQFVLISQCAAGGKGQITPRREPCASLVSEITLQAYPHIGCCCNFPFAAIKFGEIELDIISMQFTATVIQGLFRVCCGGDRKGSGSEHCRVLRRNIAVAGRDSDIASLSLATGEVNTAAR